MVVARDNLRSVVPESLLLELLDARIARRRLVSRPLSPWAAQAKRGRGRLSGQDSTRSIIERCQAALVAAFILARIVHARLGSYGRLIASDSDCADGRVVLVRDA